MDSAAAFDTDALAAARADRGEFATKADLTAAVATIKAHTARQEARIYAALVLVIAALKLLP